MVTRDPSPRNHEALQPIPFETGLQTSLDFLNAAERANEERGTDRQRHFIEITWDGDDLVDVRTHYRGADAAPKIIRSLARDDEEFAPGELRGDSGTLKLPDINKLYFNGKLATARTVLLSFAPHIRTYSEGAALLNAAKPSPEVHQTDSFFTFASIGLAKALAREPEHMQASQELLTELDMTRLLGVDKFGPFLGRLLVRDLAPPAEEASHYDLNLSADQMTAAVHAYESVYGFEPGIFSSPYAYRSFAFSQVLHHRLAVGGREEILRTARKQPTQFAGMYMAAVLGALAEDPTRNAQKLEGITRRIVVRNNAGEQNISFDRLTSVAQAVADAQRQKADSAGEAASFELLDPASMQTIGDSFDRLLSLTHSSSDTGTREIQQEQDHVYRETVDMLLAPTRRTIGRTALDPRSDTERRPGV